MEIWDVAESKLSAVLTDDAPIQKISEIDYLFFSPDGKMLLACTNQRVAIWDINGGKIVRAAQSHSRRTPAGTP